MEWEHYFEPHILNRGYDYFKDELIELDVTQNDYYKGIAYGTDEYEVTVHFKDNDLEMACSCPYAIDHNCKHMAALLYEIETFEMKRPAEKKNVSKQVKEDYIDRLDVRVLREFVKRVTQDCGQWYVYLKHVNHHMQFELSDINFADTHNDAEVYAENDRYIHFHTPSQLIKYYANYYQYKQFPKFHKLMNDYREQKKFHEKHNQKHALFIFPEKVAMPKCYVKAMGQYGFTTEKMELYHLKTMPKTKLTDIDIKQVSHNDDIFKDFLEVCREGELEYGEEFADLKQRTHERDLDDDNILQLVAYKHGFPAGKVEAIESEYYIELDDFYVLDAMRKQGIGTALQQAVWQYANNLGKQVILIADGNDSPREMYQKQGYVLVSERYELLRVPMKVMNLVETRKEMDYDEDRYKGSLEKGKFARNLLTPPFEIIGESISKREALIYFIQTLKKQHCNVQYELCHDLFVALLRVYVYKEQIYREFSNKIVMEIPKVKIVQEELDFELSDLEELLACLHVEGLDFKVEFMKEVNRLNVLLDKEIGVVTTLIECLEDDFVALISSYVKYHYANGKVFNSRRRMLGIMLGHFELEK
ncbi:GNAT family N-acetyltransferase [Macrococcus animalis]|uniref:GNAT family N-acetyltransferase n=1 Tax=Macrococcus animalis TaxID=3395467 RepID=UPI0039BE4B3C